VTATAAVALFAALFVGTHLLMSHPLRAPLVARLGPRGFQAAYSAVSFATFIPMIIARRNTGPQPWLWQPGEALWWTAAVLMLAASVLLVGSFVRNPAMVTMQQHDAVIGQPSGVFRITRHPMMWSFALWALAHLLVQPEPAAMIIAVAVLVLALAGSAGQDAKKRQQLGDRWREWVARTSFVPFARGVAFPGWFALAGGVLLFTGATWLHPIPVGVWRWLL